MTDDDYTHRASDPVLAALVTQVMGIGQQVGKVIEGQRQADRRQCQEDADHLRLIGKIEGLGDRVDELRREMEDVPREQHLDDHQHMRAERELLAAKRRKEQQRREFWAGALNKLLERGLLKAGLFIGGMLVVMFWDQFIDGVQRAAAWWRAHRGP